MKCQKCEKPATFHITEIRGEDYVALHLCADCAEKYLKPNVTAGGAGAPSLAQQIAGTKSDEELAKLDQKACPVCGITFLEFRRIGRLGCPHDYEFFEKELEPLIVNIHGAAEHRGKQPKRQMIDAEVQTELIRLRRRMKEAVEKEDYEAASSIRDAIRRLEKEGRA